MHQLAFRIAGIVVRAERQNAGIEDAAGITVNLVPSGVFVLVCNKRIGINMCILHVKGGGPREFQVSRILTCKLCHSTILHQIYPQKVLKWPWECFLWKSLFKFWLRFFGFGESPWPRKFFFRKFFYENCIFYISQYFFKISKTCVKRHVWAYNLGNRFLIFDFFDFWAPKKSNLAARLRFLGPQKSKKAKIENRLPKLFAQTCLLTHVFKFLEKY